MTNKQVESCFLNRNSSIHICCTDSLIMTHRGGLSLSIIIWRIGGERPSFLLPWGPNKFSWRHKRCINSAAHTPVILTAPKLF